MLAPDYDPMDDDTCTAVTERTSRDRQGDRQQRRGRDRCQLVQTLLPMKWLSSGGSGTTSQLIAALDWIV
jgi:hypothetical protein